MAVVSGMAVAGMVLARDEKARKAVKNGVGEMIKGARSMLMEGAERYSAFQHRIAVADRRVKHKKI